MTAETETAILDRVIDPTRGDYEPDVAPAILQLTFRPSDMARMEALGNLSQTDDLSPEQRVEYENYVRVGHFIALLHSRARRPLQHSHAA